MTYRNDAWAPRVEQFAAYLDGELSDAERARVEEWLAGHAEAGAAIEAHRRLGHLWKASAASEPSQDGWRQVLAGIEARLSDPRGPQTGPPQEPTAMRARRPLAWLIAGLTATAAALLLTWILPRAPHDPLPVTTAEDVEIISVDAADVGLLVMGEPPLRGPLVLAAPGDVVLERAEKEELSKGWPVRVESDDAIAPMIVAPLARGPGGEH